MATSASSALSSVAEAGRRAVDALQSVTGIFRDMAGSVGGALSPALKPLIDQIRQSLTPVLANLKKQFADFGAYLSTTFGPFIAGLKGAFAGLAAVLGPPFERVRDTMGKVGSAVMGVGKAFLDVTSATIGTAGALAGFAAKLAQSGVAILRLPMNVLDSAISAVGMSITRFVQHANPGEVMRLNLALDSLYATIGAALTPVIQTATQVFQAIGGALAGLDGNGKKVIQGIAAGTVALVAFGAAMVAIETVATGGLGPLLTGIAAAFMGVFAATTDIKPMLDAVARTMGGVMNAVGGALAALEPLGGMVLEVMQEVGNVLAGMIAHWAGVVRGIGPALQDVFTAIKAVGAAFAPVIETYLGAIQGTWATAIQGIADIARQAAPYVVILAEVLGQFVKSVMGVVKELLAFIGVSVAEFKAPEGKMGTPQSPVRPAQIGSVEDQLKRAQTAAYSLGGGGQKPEEKTAAHTSTIAAEMAIIRGRFDALVGAVGSIATEVVNFPGNVAKAIREAPREAARAVENQVRDTANSLGVGDVVGSIFDTANEAADRLRKNLPTWLQP